MIMINSLLFSYPGKSDFKLAISDLKIGDGEKVCIVGPSGSGKTTLINIVTGIYKPLGGTVSVNGIYISDKNEKEIREFRINKVGYIYQDFGLIDYLTVRDNVLLPFFLNPGKNAGREVRERTMAILSRLGLESMASRYPSELSHGEKQRAAIARALIVNPEIIIGDEATGNLDVKTAESIMQLLLEVVNESSATLLFVTHNLSLVKYFNRVIDLNEINA